MAYKDKEKKREYMREYFQRPEVKEHVREYMREYFQRKRNQYALDEFKEFLQIMEQHPECELAKAVAEIQSEHEQKELENA